MPLAACTRSDSLFSVISCLLIFATRKPSLDFAPTISTTFLCDIKLCLLTLTFNHDMDSFKLNKHAKYLDQKLCHSKVTILHTQIDIHTNKHTHPPYIRPTGCFFRTITFVVNIGCTKTQRFVTSILIHVFVAVVYRVSGLRSAINL